MKDELRSLMQQAYNAGFLPSIEWRQAEIFINMLPDSKVQSEINDYKKLLASKQAA